MVAGTIQGSPAEAAGFMSGDVLLRLAGEDVTVRFAEELPLFNQRVMRLPIGHPVEAVALRGGQRRTLWVKAAEREPARAREGEIASWGIAASNLTPWAAKDLHRADVDGVWLRSVRPGGPAAEAKPAMRENDVIVRLDSGPLRSVEELLERSERLLTVSTPTSVLVGFERDGESYLTVVELGRPPLEDPGLETRKASLPGAVQVVTRELAAKLGIPGQTGVRVTRVDDKGSSLHLGDIVSAVEGDPVRASQPGETELFAEMLRRYSVGATVNLTVLRDGRQERVPVVLQPSPRLAREMKRLDVERFDFRVRDIAPAERLQAGLPGDAGGVVVDSVAQGGWAALAHLADGDIVLSIDGRKVRTVDEVREQLVEVAKAKPPAVVLLVRRGVRMLFVEMQTSWRE
jgi:serine protease Do